MEHGLMLQKILFVLRHSGVSVLVFAPGSGSIGSRRSIQKLQDSAQRSRQPLSGQGTPTTFTNGAFINAVPLMATLSLHTKTLSFVHGIMGAVHAAAADDSGLHRKLMDAGLLGKASGGQEGGGRGRGGRGARGRGGGGEARMARVPLMVPRRNVGTSREAAPKNVAVRAPQPQDGAALPPLHSSSQVPLVEAVGQSLRNEGNAVSVARTSNSQLSPAPTVVWSGWLVSLHMVRFRFCW
jgi:hypothetical protein